MEASKPIVGSYSNPDAEGPVTTTAAKALVDGIESDLGQQVEEDTLTVEKAKSYEEILKEADISVEEAQVIVDDILMKGYYEETYKVTNRISVTLRTRSHADFIRYHLALEANNPKFMDEMQEIALRFFLAGSLVRLGDTVFNHPDRDKATDDQLHDAFDKRLRWIEKQPERVIALLADKLNKFDKKVAVVMSEGVVENF
jgi:hypothetical protein